MTGIGDDEGDYSGFATAPDLYFGNPFQAANTYVFEAQKSVTEQITKINNIFSAAAGVAAEGNTLADILTKLGENFKVDLDIDITDPVDPNPDFTYDSTFPIIDPIKSPNFGTISPPVIPDPIDSGPVDDVTVPTIPEFDPTYVSLRIPDDPDPIKVTDPGAPPPTPPFSYPEEITITIPPSPNLEDVNVPVFPGITLPPFDPSYPVFQGTPINAVLDWVEPTYTEEVIDEIKTKIVELLNGGSAIDPAVEEAIMARGRDREDRLVRQQEQQAIDEWANKGYTAPPGLLVQRIDNIRDDGTIKKLGINRELVIKTHQDEIDNLRFAVQQGIEAEKLYVQLFLAATARLFEAQKQTIQWALDVYNLYVTLFNAKMQEVQIRAQVYEVQVRAALADIEVYKAQIEGELAKAEVNKAVVEAYKAEIEGQEAIVRLYEAEIRAVSERVKAFSAEIDAYRGEVEAYAAKISGEKLRFDAFEAKVRGELGKASITEAEARAYQAEVQGIGIGVNAEAEAVRAQVAKLQADIAAYSANIEGQLTRAQIELNAIQAHARGYEADATRFAAEAGLSEAEERTLVSVWEAGLRNQIEYFKAQIANYETDLRNVLKETEISLGSLQAAGQIQSTIAGGALAAAHVSASMAGNAATTGTGTESSNWNQAWNRSCSQAKNLSISYESTAEPELNCGF